MQSHLRINIVMMVLLVEAIALSFIRKANETPIPQGVVLCKAVVVSQPVVKGRVLRMDLMADDGSGSFQQVQASLLRDTISNRWKSLRLGSVIKFASEWKKTAKGKYPTTFIYYKNWQLEPVDYSFLPFIQKLHFAFLVVRHRLILRLQDSGLSNRAFAVVAAMTLGDRSALKSDIRNVYNATGTAHVLALSGLHLSIIFTLLMFFFDSLRCRIIGLHLVIPVVWTYVMLVGLPPSLVRAAVMLSLYAICTLLRRKAFSLNSLAFAAFVILLFNPSALSDVGFQLSFTSVLGILIFYRPFSTMLCVKKLSWLKWITDMLAVSLAAQVATLPLLLYYFGYFSSYFLLANLIIVPVASVIVSLSMLFYVTSFFGSLCAVNGLVVIILNQLIDIQYNMMLNISSWPYATIELHIPEFLVYILYFMMALAYQTGVVILRIYHRSEILRYR